MDFQRLAENDIHYLAILGNIDLVSLNTMFENVCSEFSNVHYIANNKIELNGYEFIGMDKIMNHPIGSKDRVVMEKDYIFQNQLSPIVSWFNGEGYKKIFTTNWEEHAKENLSYFYNKERICNSYILCIKCAIITLVKMSDLLPTEPVAEMQHY